MRLKNFLDNWHILLVIVSIILLVATLITQATPDLSQIKASEEGKLFTLEKGSSRVHKAPEYTSINNTACIIVRYLGRTPSSSNSSMFSYHIEISRKNIDEGSGYPFLLSVTDTDKPIWPVAFMRIDIANATADKLVYTTYRP